MINIEPPKVSVEELERIHKVELDEYKIACKVGMKSVKKSDKAAQEAKNIQGEYDIQARHREEMELLELQIGWNFYFSFNSFD